MVEPVRRVIPRQVLCSMLEPLERGDLSPYCMKLLEELSVSDEKMDSLLGCSGWESVFANYGCAGVGKGSSLL